MERRKPVEEVQRLKFSTPGCRVKRNGRLRSLLFTLLALATLLLTHRNVDEVDDATALSALPHPPLILSESGGGVRSWYTCVAVHDEDRIPSTSIPVQDLENLVANHSTILVGVLERPRHACRGRLDVDVLVTVPLQLATNLLEAFGAMIL